MASRWCSCSGWLGSASGSGSPTTQAPERSSGSTRNGRCCGAGLTAWGLGAPLVVIAIQAVQVLVAPIPGEVTGLLGGFVFGPWGGLGYSMVGLTAGSLAAFAAGRGLGSATVRRLMSPEVWCRLGLVMEAEGAIVCFVLYLTRGFPKDVLCYPFGLSPNAFKPCAA